MKEIKLCLAAVASIYLVIAKAHHDPKAEELICEVEQQTWCAQFYDRRHAIGHLWLIKMLVPLKDGMLTCQ